MDPVRTTLHIGPLVLVLGATLLASAAAAADGSEQIGVAVEATDFLSVPETVGLILTTSTPGAGAYDESSRTIADGFEITHNHAETMKLTATSMAAALNSPNDITLVLRVGAQAETLVDAGADRSEVPVANPIPAGSTVADFGWTASASLAGTSPGTFAWTVTLTSTDS